MDLGQTCPPKSLTSSVIHFISAVADATATESTPTTSRSKFMSAQEIMDYITPSILYLQECATNEILTDLLHRIIDDKVGYLKCLESGLENLQALTSDPTATIIPYIKDKNARFHQINPLILLQQVTYTIILNNNT